MANARNHMSGTESRLFDLWEILIDILVELQLSNKFNRQQLLWPDFSGVQNVEIEIILAGLRAGLYAEFPCRKDSTADSVR